MSYLEWYEKIDVLSQDEVSRRLQDLDDGWSGDPTALRRTVNATDFPTAMSIVDAVAEVAEEIDHHPDIDIRWRTRHFSTNVKRVSPT